MHPSDLARLQRASITAVLSLQPNMPQAPPAPPAPGPALAFDRVQFSYVPGKPVLRDATFSLEPGKTYAIDVELFPTSNFFEAGHRVRIEVSSSDFPNFGRNLNTGKNNETTSEIRVAHTRILHSKDAPSSITLPVIK